MRTNPAPDTFPNDFFSMRQVEMVAGRRFGAHLNGDGAAFRIWAPTDLSVTLQLEGRQIDMPDCGGGWRQADIPGIVSGARYSFLIGGETAVPDPASRFQPDGVFGRSQVVDPATFQWTDQSWRGRPWHEAVIWEVHVGTATPDGTYRALIDRLRHLRETGITAIELMPIAECPGTRNWGYDGVLPYAPMSAYGTPEDLKALIDAAHAEGIMVLLDVVYNHFGPSGNYLHLYAKSFFTERHQTPWGGGINFDGPGSDLVRSFFIDNALYWIEEFHFDGLRFDAAHALIDDSDEHILASLARTIRTRVDREVHLILENEHNESHWLGRDAKGHPTHFTAQWNDDFHHCWHVLTTGEAEGYYANFHPDAARLLATSLAEGFVFQGQVGASGAPRGEPSAHLPPTAFVSFLQNHDQVGNRAFGERLSVLAKAHELDVARAVFLLCPQVPMLFMGEEWGSRTPFCFFVDFADDPDLSKAVREGRRREFAAFAAYAGESTSSIPDPTALSTFEMSRLDWSDLDKADHARILTHTRQLLDLRARYVTPLLATHWRGARLMAQAPLDLVWRFGAGALRLVLNLSQTAIQRAQQPAETVIYASANCIPQEAGHLLEPWSCLFTTTQKA